MNQTCAEEMLRKAAQLVLGQDINFTYEKAVPDIYEKAVPDIYEKAVPDIQVDLGPAFMNSPDEQKKVWYSGKEQEDLEKDLNSLEPERVYFLRTGTNSGPGHWQILYFDEERDGWINHSTETNNYQLLQAGKLTKQGRGLLAPKGRWGKDKGEYCFFVAEASRSNLIKAANYLYDFRMFGDEVALEKLWDPQPNLYEQLFSRHSAIMEVGQLSQSVQAAGLRREARIQKFNVLLQRLEEKCNELITKAKTKRNYDKAGDAAEQLITSLRQDGDLWQSGQLPEQAFKVKCAAAIAKAGQEFINHRGWHDLHPILRGLLGIVAALTVIPAVFVGGTRQGYLGTFFRTPRTDSAEKLHDFQDRLTFEVFRDNN